MKRREDLRTAKRVHRVLYVSLDLFGHGGIQRYSRYEIRALNTICDHQVRVCSFGHPVAQGFDAPIRLSVVGTGRGWLARMRFIVAVVREAIAWHPTLIICDHVNLAPLAWAAARLAGARYFINTYGIEVWGPLSVGRRFALCGADRVVSDCDFTRQRLEQTYPTLKGRVDLLRCCVDTTTFAPVVHEAQEVDRPDVVRVLTVSRLLPDRDKGHSTVLRAAALLKERGLRVEYSMAGNGSDRARIEGVAQALGIADQLTFLGRVADPDLPRVYEECDVFALVSRFSLAWPLQGEGVPLVVLEAQACGKPVITSRCDGSAEAILDGTTGYLVTPDVPEEVSEALQRLWPSSTRRRMGAEARRFVESQFAYPVFLDTLKSILSAASVR